jgi:hypothetical protein
MTTFPGFGPASRRRAPNLVGQVYELARSSGGELAGCGQLPFPLRSRPEPERLVERPVRQEGRVEAMVTFDSHLLLIAGGRQAAPNVVTAGHEYPVFGLVPMTDANEKLLVRSIRRPQPNFLHMFSRERHGE